MSKIKLVVVDEHTLGYIHPKTPNTLVVFRALVTKGSNYNDMENYTIMPNNKVRLASQKDFDEYRVSFKGYENEEIYEFEKP